MNSKWIYASIGKIAGAYDVTLRLSGYERSVEFFVSQLPLEKKAVVSVLDAGCGTGLFTLAILKRYPNARVVAFDLNANLVDQLRKKIHEKHWDSRVQLFSRDIREPFLEISDSFDLIITAGVLEYLPLKETVSALSRLLRPQGYFFNAPIRNTRWGNMVARMYGCKPYSREENLAAFRPGYLLIKIVELPSYTLASFKEGLLFQKK